MSGTDVESMAIKRYRRGKYVEATEKSLFSTSDLTCGAVQRLWSDAQTPDPFAQHAASDTITVKAPRWSRAQRYLGNSSGMAAVPFCLRNCRQAGPENLDSLKEL